MTLRMYAERKGLALESVEVRLSHRRIHAKDCEDCETEDGFARGEPFLHFPEVGESSTVLVIGSILAAGSRLRDRSRVSGLISRYRTVL